MPRDWQRSVVTLSATVVTVVVILALYFARAVFIPVALSIFLAFVLSPVVSRLQRQGLGRTPAVFLTVGFVLIGTFGIGAVIAQQVSGLMTTLPDQADAIKHKVATAKLWVVGNGNDRFNHFVDEITSMIAPKPQAQPVVVESSGQTLGWFGVYLTPAAEFVGQAAFAFVLTVYMLVRREDLRNRWIRLLGGGKVTTTTKAVDEASRRISRYLLAQFLVNLGFGAVISLLLLLIGVDFALLWGCIATLMRYIPYVGIWIGMIPPVLFSFATSPDWSQPITVLSIYVVFELCTGNIIEPLLYGHSMGVSEVALLVSAAFWAFLWGPIGLVLSGPMTGCLLVVGKHVRQFEFLDVLLGDEPALTPEIAFYQRLAARDQDEAAEVALKVARETSPTEAFEKVLIPALCLARRDADEGDLDHDALRFVVHGTREIGGEVAEEREIVVPAEEQTQLRLLIVPARDEVEHAAAEILAESLDPRRWEARVAGDEMLASELCTVVGEERPDVVVLLTLPPGGLSHTRYLVTRLRSRCPQTRVILARWGAIATEKPAGGGPEGLKGVEAFTHTLTATLQQLSEMHPVLAAKKEAEDAPTKKRPPVGTLSA